MVIRKEPVFANRKIREGGGKIISHSAKMSRRGCQNKNVGDTNKAFKYEAP